MPKPRGRQHTTFTQTARLVARIITKQPGVKMLAPGEIAPTRSKSQRITVTHTKAGLSLTVCGTGIQKLAIHTTSPQAATELVNTLKSHSALRDFRIAERVRRPGI